MTTPKSPTATKAVYTVIERGTRSHWVRIGIAFENRDGSFNVRLDALPVNGTLHIRDEGPKDGEPVEATALRPVPHVSEASQVA